MADIALKKARRPDKLLFAAIGAAALFWICEASVHIVVFGESDFAAQLFAPDAHELWMRSIGVALFVAFGLYARSSVQQLRRAEAAVRERERFLQGVFDAIQDGILVHDRDLKVTRANHWMERKYASTMPLEGKKCFAALQNRKSPCPWCVSMRAMETGQTQIGVVPFPSAENPTGWNEVTAFPLRDEDGNIQGAIEHMRDITERRRAEAALRESERFLQNVFDAIQDGLSVLDRDLNIVRANAWMQRMYAHQAPLEGKCCHAAYQQRDTVCPWCPTVKALETGEMQSAEVPYPSAADVKGWIDVSAFPLKNERGEVTGVIEYVKDVTQRKQAEEEQQRLEAELRQSHKLEAIGQLAGGVAHDFNNILTAIMGNVELSMGVLRQEARPNQSLIAAMEQVEKSAERASRLTRQLLAFSRRQVSQPETLNVNEILADLDRMLRRLITENIECDVILAPDLATVRADQGQIEQVIINLVVNAADAMPDGGRLVLETGNVTLDDEYANTHADVTPGAYVLLAVSDTGEGMDSATRERIFEPFFTTKPRERGTGLGLATVHGVVKQASGHISVYSEPGHGTTFKVYLPVAVGPAAAPARATVVEQSLEAYETLLLCEDDQPVRELTAHVLQTAGYTVLAASSGREALEMVGKYNRPVDLLITDVIMTDMNGRQLADALRAKRPDLPTLFISGYTSNVIADHGVLDEGVEFLGKPFTRDQLLQRAREVLQRHKAQPGAV